MDAFADEARQAGYAHLSAHAIAPEPLRHLTRMGAERVPQVPDHPSPYLRLALQPSGAAGREKFAYVTDDLDGPYDTMGRPRRSLMDPAIGVAGDPRPAMAALREASEEPDWARVPAAVRWEVVMRLAEQVGVESPETLTDLHFQQPMEVLGGKTAARLYRLYDEEHRVRGLPPQLSTPEFLALSLRLALRQPTSQALMRFFTASEWRMLCLAVAGYGLLDMRDAFGGFYTDETVRKQLEQVRKRLRLPDAPGRVAEMAAADVIRALARLSVASRLTPLMTKEVNRVLVAPEITELEILYEAAIAATPEQATVEAVARRLELSTEALTQRYLPSLLLKMEIYLERDEGTLTWPRAVYLARRAMTMLSLSREEDRDALVREALEQTGVTAPPTGPARAPLRPLSPWMRRALLFIIESVLTEQHLLSPAERAVLRYHYGTPVEREEAAARAQLRLELLEQVRLKVAMTFVILAMREGQLTPQDIEAAVDSPVIRLVLQEFTRRTDYLALMEEHALSPVQFAQHVVSAFPDFAAALEPTVAAGPEPVAVNSATQETIATLLGRVDVVRQNFGQDGVVVLAQDIARERKRHGPFQNHQDFVKRIRGIGTRMGEALEPFLRYEGVPPDAGAPKSLYHTLIAAYGWFIVAWTVWWLGPGQGLAGASPWALLPAAVSVLLVANVLLFIISRHVVAALTGGFGVIDGFSQHPRKWHDGHEIAANVRGRIVSLDYGWLHDLSPSVQDWLILRREQHLLQRLPAGDALVYVFVDPLYTAVVIALLPFAVIRGITRALGWAVSLATWRSATAHVSAFWRGGHVAGPGLARAVEDPKVKRYVRRRSLARAPREQRLERIAQHLQQQRLVERDALTPHYLREVFLALPDTLPNGQIKAAFLDAPDPRQPVIRPVIVGFTVAAIGLAFLLALLWVYAAAGVDISGGVVEEPAQPWWTDLAQFIQSWPYLAMASAGEEIIFRQGLFQWLRRRLPHPLANALQAALFALIHHVFFAFSGSPWFVTDRPWPMFPHFFLGGLLYGEAYRRQGLSGSVIGHVTYNTAVTASAVTPLAYLASIPGLFFGAWWLRRHLEVSPDETSPWWRRWWRAVRGVLGRGKTLGQVRTYTAFPSAAVLDPLALEAGETFLDIGSGPGVHTIAAGLRGVRAVGVEINAGNVALAQRLLRAVRAHPAEAAGLLSRPYGNLPQVLSALEAQPQARSCASRTRPDARFLQTDAAHLPLASASVDKAAWMNADAVMSGPQRRRAAVELFRVMKAGGSIHLTSVEGLAWFFQAARREGVVLAVVNRDPPTFGVVVKIVEKPVQPDREASLGTWAATAVPSEEVVQRRP
jgi:membrane protease YdiL (CAAX protease family)